MNETVVKVENAEYYDWCSPLSDGNFDGKNSKYALLEAFLVDGDLEIYLRKSRGVKTDFRLEIPERYVRELYKMLQEAYRDD